MVGGANRQREGVAGLTRLDLSSFNESNAGASVCMTHGLPIFGVGLLPAPTFMFVYVLGLGFS